VKKERRDRFALFLLGWLGGPKDYVEQHGHPRLRMRHAPVRIDTSLRDAWVRCMVKAMAQQGIPDEVRTFLEPRFSEVADFLRNVPEPSSQA
jgi:hemoglobin